MITIEQLKDVKTRTEALYRYLDIENKKIQVEEEQLRTQAPGFWDDAKAAEEQMKKVKGLQKWIDGYKEVKTLCDELELAFDFYKEEMVTEEEVDGLYGRTVDALEDLELRNMLRQEEDPMDAVLKINSGAGGTESQDWASMLMRMYMRWAESHGYKCTVSNYQDGDEAGIKTVTMQIVCIGVRDAFGGRFHRSVCGPVPCVMGLVPFRRCRRTERQQGGDRRALALPI